MPRHRSAIHLRVMLRARHAGIRTPCIRLPGHCSRCAWRWPPARRALHDADLLAPEGPHEQGLSVLDAAHASAPPTERPTTACTANRIARGDPAAPGLSRLRHDREAGLLFSSRFAGMGRRRCKVSGISGGDPACRQSIRRMDEKFTAATAGIPVMPTPRSNRPPRWTSFWKTAADHGCATARRRRRRTTNRRPLRLPSPNGASHVQTW